MPWFGCDGRLFQQHLVTIARAKFFNILHYIHASLTVLPCCWLVVRGSRPGKNVQLAENEIRGLCLKSREIFLSQPILLELEAPLKICGWLTVCILIDLCLILSF